MLDDVRINGVPFAWIDAKHFYGADPRFPRKKTQKQVDRYVKGKWQGAIVYRHGFTGSLVQKGAILLDASPLDLTPLDEFPEKRAGGHIYDSGPTLVRVTSNPSWLIPTINF
ncbi:MAG: hypothetical protein Ct9H90mP14_2770 [Methanobacteriota archaeon]|nr:MAG: hypothetical protein Ct9H90mP14_2770 [Euryarchaeota archaeon]